MKNMFDLTGKVAVVTGASSGLGADAARAYAEFGAGVAILARRKEKLDALVEELKGKNCKVLAVKCDVIDEVSVRNAVEEVINFFGKIDILLNNAGLAKTGLVEELDMETWDAVVDTNLKGPFLMCKYVMPHMRKQKYGKIINISSINAVVADKYLPVTRPAYNASKAGVHGLTIGIAATCMTDNITVNTIGPGLFDTEMTEDLVLVEPWMETYIKMTPAERGGARNELNGTVIYLSSDASSYVTGQVIYVDGGNTIT